MQFLQTGIGTEPTLTILLLRFLNPFNSGLALLPHPFSRAVNLWKNRVSCLGEWPTFWTWQIV